MTDYTNITGTMFIALHNPGEYASPAWAQNFDSKWQQQLDNWKKAYAIFHTYNNVHKTLKKQLISSVSIQYIDTLKDESYGFEDVNIQSIMAYLYTTYGHILDPDLEKNNICMMKVCNQSQPMSVLIKQLELGCRFAAAGKQIIIDNIMIYKGVTVIIQTVVFTPMLKNGAGVQPPTKRGNTFKNTSTKHIVSCRKQQQQDRMVTKPKSIIYLALELLKQKIFQMTTKHTTAMVDVYQHSPKRLKPI